MMPYTIIGWDKEAMKALLDDGAEVKITDVIGDQACVALPDGSFGCFDMTGETLTKQ